MLFSKSVFKLAVPLLIGAILATGKRTVTSALRVVGLSEERNFPKYHRVLSLSKWSARQASQILLRQLLDWFLPDGPVVVGIDETIERRWGHRGAVLRSRREASIGTAYVAAKSTLSKPVVCVG